MNTYNELKTQQFKAQFCETENPIKEIVYEIEDLEALLIKSQNKLNNQKIKTDLQRRYKKNKEFIYRNRLIEKIYHIRDSQNAPRITVCILFDPKKNMYCRGVSICSRLDCVNKEEGRDIAEDRAVQAMKSEKSSRRFISKEAIINFRKSDYNLTNLSNFEKRLFRQQLV